MGFNFELLFPMAGVLIILVISAITITVIFENAFIRDKEKELSIGKRFLRIMSLMTNIVWAILFIPISSLCLIAAAEASTISGSVAEIFLIRLSIWLFWASPFLALLCVILSFIFRKKEKFLLSLLIQIIPFFTPILALYALFNYFWAA